VSATITQMPTEPVALAEGAIGPHEAIGPITRTDIVRYAGASGDFNPIHHDEEFARAAGMPSVFSIGMHTAGLLGQYVARWAGLANVRQFSVRFTGQVWPGDVLTLAGQVERVQETDSEPLARLALTVTRQTGDVVVKGSATVRVAGTEV
jgi:acyl dehydratase